MRTKHLFLTTALLVGSLDAAVHAQDLMGIHFDSGILYSIDGSTAAVTAIGSTGIGQAASLDVAPNGKLYAFNAGTPNALFEIDPKTALATQVAPSLGIGFVFEGGLAIAPDGTAYGMSQDDSTDPALFEIDLETGLAEVTVLLAGGNADMNGLAWRIDGKLIGLDRVSNSLLEIDPETGAVNVIAPALGGVGNAGGMSIRGGVGYYNTAATTGSNSLWRFDPFSGEQELIGSFGGAITGTGMAGLVGPGPTIGQPQPLTAGSFSTIQLTGAAPAAVVVFSFSSSTGSSPVPGAGCTSLTYDLGRPRPFATALTNADGDATLVASIPPSAAGLTIFYQAADVSSCTVSNLVQVTLP
ncbi:MAG: hypothetical protein AAF682_02240 [Planctomycetota bacterium]